MPQDLDDFDLEPTRRSADEETVTPYRPEPPSGGGIGFPAILALLAVVAIGLLGVVFLVFRHPAKPQASPTPAPLASVAAPAASASPSPAPEIALPSLADSDAFVRSLAAALSAHPELARWLAHTGLVRTLTAVVANVAEGASPRAHLEFLAPKQRFRAARRPARLIVPDPAGFAGYDRFADAVASVDPAAAAALYRTLLPLFEAAYVELGHPEGGFDAVLDRALAALLAVPVLRADVELVPHAIGFRYADPRLESLSPAQKQLLRIGPRNVRVVQGQLRALRAALAAAPGITPEEAPAAAGSAPPAAP
jgi:hypothetical protein